MQPRFKYGLIFGAAGMVLTGLLSWVMGICGPLVGLFAGAAAGWLTARGEKAGSKELGAQYGAVSGGIAGILLFLGQVLGSFLLSMYISANGKMPYGQTPAAITQAAQSGSFNAGVVGVAVVIGAINVVAAMAAAIAFGYIFTSEQRAPEPPSIGLALEPSARVEAGEAIVQPVPQVPAKPKSKRKVWVIAALAVTVLCIAGCAALIGFSGLGKTVVNAFTLGAAVGPGRPAPDFELPAMGGSTVRLSDYKGSPILLEFGATWCPDCHQSAPVLESLYYHAPGLVVISVDSNEPPSTVQAYVEELNLTYTILFDEDGKVANQYRVYAIPTVFFIDSDGIIRKIVIEKVTEENVEEGMEAIGYTKRQ